MANKTSRTKAAKTADDASDVQAQAAHAPATTDELNDVETAISEVQRAAGDLANEVDESAADAIHANIEDATPSSDQAHDESGDAMGEIVSALEEVDRAGQATGRPASLKDYDQAISGAVDDLLEGDFVSVDLVLEGMTESTPPPEPTEAEARDTEAGADESMAEGAAERVDAEDAPDGELDGDFVNPSEVHAPGEREDDFVEPSAAEDEAVSAPAARATSAPPSPSAASVAAPPPRSAPSDRKPQNRSAAREDESAAETSSRAASRFNRTVHTAAQGAIPIVRTAGIAVLSVMSIPMQFVPEKARDMIDWLALSLVFWVPIVWFFAIFLAG